MLFWAIGSAVYLCSVFRTIQPFYPMIVQDYLTSIFLYLLSFWISHKVYKALSILNYLFILIFEYGLSNAYISLSESILKLDRGQLFLKESDYSNIIFYFSMKAILLCLLFWWYQNRKQKKSVDAI
jgi:hypothetical protein